MVQQSYQPSSALMDGIVEEERLQRVYYNNTPKQRPSPSSTSPLLSLGSRRRGSREGGGGGGRGRGGGMKAGRIKEDVETTWITERL